MLNDQEREIVMDRIGEQIDKVVEQQYVHRLPEHLVTAKIADRISRLDGLDIGGHRIRVIAQDVISTSARPWESEIGADLYLGLSVEGDDGWDKGLLIQSKWDFNKGMPELREQCRKMLERTTSSYVWIYNSNGVSVVNADAFANHAATIKGSRGRSSRTFIGRILDCYAGDREFGVDPSGDMLAAVMQKIEKLAGVPAVVIDIEKKGGRARHKAKP